MSLLLHLNGPPGIGKSTLARRYADEHPGVLNCDIDVLRTLIGGWRDDFVGTGGIVRPAALAMIEAHLHSGHDVVLPQLLVSPAERARFQACAARADAAYVERILMDTPAAAIERFHRRGAGEEAPDPWHEQVRSIVADQGGDDVLVGYHERLANLSAVVITTVEGEVDATYRALLESLETPGAER